MCRSTPQKQVMSALMIAATIALLGSGRHAIVGAQDELTLSPPEPEGPAEPGTSPKAAASFAEATAQAAGYLGMTLDLLAPRGEFFYIASLDKNGPAAQGGLAAGDVILQIDGEAVEDRNDLRRRLAQPPGTELDFKVRRQGVPQKFSVTVRERPPEGDLPAPAASQAGRVAGELPPPRGVRESQPPREEPRPERETERPDVEMRPSLGIRVADAAALSDVDRRRFNITVKNGAVISGLTEGAAAAKAGLPLGGVIVSINGQRIGDAQDIVDLVKSFRPGEKIEVTYWDGDRIGRKEVSVGMTPVRPRGEARPERAGDEQAGRLPLRRRGSDRPILNALERLLDEVVPRESDKARDLFPTPPSGDRGDAGRARDDRGELPPPPPPPRDEAAPGSPPSELLPPPAAADSADEPAGLSTAEELRLLRSQVAEMQKTLEQVKRRIDQLEERAAREDADNE